ncbi:hypothetical protein NKH18_01235 [Streptomyces sp. M10(2022)]
MTELAAWAAEHPYPHSAESDSASSSSSPPHGWSGSTQSSTPSRKQTLRKATPNTPKNPRAHP